MHLLNHYCLLMESDLWCYFLMAFRETDDIAYVEETVGKTYKIGKAFDIAITKTRKHELNRTCVQ